MANFYYTYGLVGSHYKGGWTTVTANTRDAADRIFRAVHPCKVGTLLNCAFVYTEDDFKNTEMWKKGNFERFEVEHLFEGSRDPSWWTASDDSPQAVKCAKCDYCISLELSNEFNYCPNCGRVIEKEG